MKVGILTLPLHTNYGGILQAYALQTVLERMGHDVSMMKNGKVPLKVTLKKVIKKILRIATENKDALEIDTFKQKHFRKWINVNVKKNKSLKNLDAIVVGSDQVWRKWGEKWNILFYFLDFAQRLPIKKYAYAVSFGKDSWDLPSALTNECKILVSQFSKVSVRERQGVELCKNFLNVDVEWLLDPTFLLSKEDYMSLLMVPPSKEKKLVCYILDSDEKKKKVVQSVADLYNGRYVNINEKKNDGTGYAWPSVESWLNEIMCADFLVTDSFHGAAFAINLEIPFVVLSNENRGQSRLLSLLEMFELKTRLVVDEKEALEIVREPIQWGRIRTLKEGYKDSSLTFLRGL
jgi:hypothetical protein